VPKPPIKHSHITKAYKEPHLSNTKTFLYVKFGLKYEISNLFSAITGTVQQTRTTELYKRPDLEDLRSFSPLTHVW
jgi:hypothetical protein